MKIRKNDIVTLNKDMVVGIFYQKTISAGTQLRVWKASRDGTLYCSADPTITSQTIFVSENEVTKIEVPLPVVHVGDIFVCSWGYGQTNIDFYKVLNVKNKTAVLAPMSAVRTYTAHMQGTCIPDNNNVGTKTINKRIQRVGTQACFTINSYSVAFPWKGTAEIFTEYH